MIFLVLARCLTSLILFAVLCGICLCILSWLLLSLLDFSGRWLLLKAWLLNLLIETLNAWHSYHAALPLLFLIVKLYKLIEL